MVAAECKKYQNNKCKVVIAVDTPELPNCRNLDHQKLVCFLYRSIIRLEILQDLGFCKISRKM